MHGAGVYGAYAGGGSGLQEPPAAGLLRPYHVQQYQGKEQDDSHDAAGKKMEGFAEQYQEMKRKISMKNIKRII